MLSLQPSLGAPGTTITIQGSGFRKGEQGTLYWDSPSTPFGPFTADDAGAFRLDVKAPAGEAGQHAICPLQPGPAQGCVQFKLEAPAPSPSATPSPPAAPTPPVVAGPVASSTPGLASTDRPVAVAALLRPPFVIFPILLLLALLGGCALWIWAGRRRPPAPVATVLHRSQGPRTDAGPPAPTPAGPRSDPRAPDPAPRSGPPAPADLPAPRPAAEGSLDMPEPGD